MRTAFSATTDLSAERCENVIERSVLRMSEEKLSVFPMGEKMMPMPGILWGRAI